MNTPSKSHNNQEKRKKLFVIFGLCVAFIAVASFLYYFFIGSKHVTTDNAYVGAEIAQVCAPTGGIVKTVHFKDTDTVKKGDVLVSIDDTDAKLVLARAKADLDKAQADFDKTKTECDRRSTLSKSGSVSAEEVTKVDLERTTIRSPVDGVVAKRQVQLGQRIPVGANLMSVVPILSLHVDANFKEVQLQKVQIGQPVELTADFYGSSVVYHGKVAGIAGGTGSAFAIIPAQNATGNWIKVVQRLPVRIELDPKELKEHPLQVGLSMQVDIDISGSEK